MARSIRARTYSCTAHVRALSYMCFYIRTLMYYSCSSAREPRCFFAISHHRLVAVPLYINSSSSVFLQFLTVVLLQFLTTGFPLVYSYMHVNAFYAKLLLLPWAHSVVCARDRLPCQAPPTTVRSTWSRNALCISYELKLSYGVQELIHLKM